MSETKYTPGPWHADESGAVWRRHPSDLYENGGQVVGDRPLARACAAWDEPLQGYPLEANAQLIAAAPELYEALERSLDWLASYPGFGSEDAYNQARAALAKAGRES